MGCVLFFDGACRGNPGPMAIGVILLEDGRKVKELSKRLSTGTNNIAEWSALIEGLKLARDHGCSELEVRGDSELVTKQIKGQYRVKSENLVPLFNEARRLCSGFERLQFRWVKREENSYTNYLSHWSL